uniref:HMG box domain-containing protein n=1 Tax=Panagrolaimus sp. ES5 TaxID=591445 RepID=A0AC34GQK6_9BILA
MSSDSPPRSRSNSISQHVDADESSCISSTSNTTITKKEPTDFSNLPSHLEIHPQNATLTSNANNQHRYIKRPLNAYMIWTVEQRQKIHKEPRQKMNEISRAMGEVWKKMTDAEKAPYFEQAKKYSDEHKKALRDNPNLAYVPSKKKMRLTSKNPENDKSVSNASSPDLSDLPDSPAVLNSRSTSFAPMSPPLNLHQQLQRSSQTPLSLTPRISYYHPVSANGESLDGHSTVRIVPANRANVAQQSVQQGMIPVYESSAYTVMSQPPNGHFQAPQLPQSSQRPQQSLQPPQTTTIGGTNETLLNSNQLRERYYAALCQPQFPNLFESPSKIRDANYYYDLHLQLQKRPL